MWDAIGGDIRLDYCGSVEKSKSTNVEDVKPVCEEITTMKTEVIEEFYNYKTLDGVECDDVKSFSTLEYFQSVTDEYPAISPYEQTLKKNCYEQHMASSKEENDSGLSAENVATKIEKKYACDKCSYISKSRPCFLRHVLVHGKRQLKCETCKRLFKRKYMLEKHCKEHCKQRQQYKCDICNYVTKRKPDFRRHILLHGGKKQFKCETCGTLFRQKDYLKKHELVKHSDGHKLYKCMYCKHSTHYKTILENHENFMCEQQHVSNKEEPCDCDPCQFETAYVTSLKDHLLAKHNAKTERHKCTSCTYSTHFEAYLKKHIMRAHASKESPNKYKCEYCHHMTHSKENLKKHTLIHTKEKIFKCTYINCKCDSVREKACDCEACSYHTIHRRALKSHILRKHSVEAKKHTCTYCDYSTHFKGNLKCHLLRKHANAKSIPSENS